MALVALALLPGLAEAEPPVLQDGGIYRAGETVILPFEELNAKKPPIVEAWAMRPWSVFGTEEPDYVKLSPKKDGGKWQVTLPEFEESGYVGLHLVKQPRFWERQSPIRRVALGVVRNDQKNGPLVWIHLPQRRQVYVCGERIEVSVIVSAVGVACSGGCELELAPPTGGAGVPLGGRKLSVAANSRRTFGFMLPARATGTLRPGRYLLRTAFPGAATAEAEVEFVSSMRATNYPVPYINYFDFGLQEVLSAASRAPRRAHYKSPKSSRALATRQTIGAGFNTIMVPLRFPVGELSTRMDGVCKRRHEQPDLAAALPPPESFVRPYEWSDIAEEFLRTGVALINGLYFSYYTDHPTIPCGSEELMGRHERWATLATQAMRRYPHFAGMMCTHWSKYPHSGEKDPFSKKDNMLCLEPLWEEFCEKHGLEIPYPGDHWLYRAPAAGPLSVKHPKLWRAWVEFVRSIPSRALKRLSEADRAICPGMIHTDCRNYPRQNAFPIYDALFSNYSSGQDPLLSTGGLDTVITNMPGMDWETMPYMQSLNCDLYSTLLRHGRGCWSAATRGAVYQADKSTFLRDVLQQLARGSVPCFTYYGRGYLQWADNQYLQNETMEWTHQRGIRDRVQLCTRILRQYGDVFLKLRPASEVAILASLTQGAFDNERRHGHAIHQLGATCLWAGHPATYLHEYDIEAGHLKDCKILLLSSIQHELPQKVTAEILKFIRGGGRVVADGATTIEIPGMEKTGRTFDEWRQYFTGWIRDFFKDRKKVYRHEIHESTWWEMNQFAAKNAPALKEIIEQSVRRRMSSPDPLVFVSRNTAGNVAYWFVVNFRTMVNMQRRLPGMYQLYVAPHALWLDVNEVGQGAIYDVLEMKQVVPVLKGGKERILCDLRDLQGRIYAWTPEPVAGVELSVQRKVGAGGRVPIQITVKGTSGEALAGAVPVAIVVRSPRGDEVHRVYRAADADGLMESLPVYADAEPGEWEVLVQERLSGKAVRATFTVVSRPVRKLLAVTSLGDCTVVEPDAIKAFAERKRRVFIPLDGDQETLRRFAQETASRLAKIGIECSVRPVEELITGKNYQNWKKPKRILSPAPLVPGDLILIARPGRNRLLESLVRSDVLLRQPGPSYPGPARGLVQYVRDAFCPGCDAVVVLGGDTEGLNVALDETLRLLSGKRPDRGVTLVAAPEKARTAFIPGDVRGRREQKLPAFFRAMKVRRLKGRVNRGSPAELTARRDAAIAERTGVPVYCMACSPDGSKIVVGTDALRNNLKLFSSDGKLLADFSAGDVWPHRVAVTNAGAVIAATTANHKVSAWKADGTPIWTATAVTANSLSGMLGQVRDREPDYFATSPDGGHVYLFLPGGKLVRRETQTGKDTWTYDFSSPPVEQLLAKPMRLCASADGKKVAVSVKYGIMTDKISQELYKAASPCVVALDAATGKPLWKKAMGMPRWDGKPAPPRSSHWTAYGGWPPNGVYPEWWEGARKPAAAHYERAPRNDYPLGKSLGLSPDGRWLCVGAQGGSVALYSLELPAEEQKRTPWLGRRASLPTAPDDIMGGRMVFSGDGNTLAIVPLQTNSCNPCQRRMAVGVWIYHLEGKEGAVVGGEESPSDCALNHDGSRIAIGRWDGYLYLADRSGEILWKRWVGGGSRVAISPDGAKILAGTSTGRLYLFDQNGKDLWSVSCTTPAEKVVAQ